MKRITLVVMGEPIAKGRPKFRVVGRHAMAYTPKKTHDAEKVIKDEFVKYHNDFKMPDKCPICLKVRFYMPIPSSLSKPKKKTLLSDFYHLKRPDVDNLLKLVCDALNGVAWKDDSDIASTFAVKGYSEVPRTEIEIKYLTNV